MSVDAKCYECISGAGLEPILDKRYINSKTPFTLAKEYPKDVLKSFQDDPSVPPSMKEKLGVAMGLSGGRGQASGFIMRMMAENKKKHQGQYRNPSDNDYGSTMNKFRAFDYERLANADQNGTNQSDYGASPFIIKHFGSPDAVPFIPKAQRGSEEHRVVEGETEEQKAARLNAKAEELAQLAKDLLEKSAAKGKIKGFLKGRIAVKKAKELLQEKKATSYAEKLRLMKEAEQKDFEKSAREYAGELRTEWSKVDKAIYDYLSYKYKGEEDVYSRRSNLRELMKKFFTDKMKAKFPNFEKRFDKLGYNERSRIIPSVSYDGPSIPYGYKKLPYGEAKRIYDATFPKEEEDLDEEGRAMVEAEEAERKRGLKGVVRRLVRKKRSEKDLVSKATLPKFWNAYMCVEDFAKNKPYSNMGTLIQNKKWFGEWTYSMGNSPVSKWTFSPEDIVEIPPEKKETKKERDAYRAAFKKIEDEFAPQMAEAKKTKGAWLAVQQAQNKAVDELQKKMRDADPRNQAIERSNAQYKEAQDAIIKITATYYEWVFKKALPMFGWKLIDYHPRVEDFPKEIQFKTENRGKPEAPRYYYKAVGEYPSHLLMSITNTESPRYGYDGSRPQPEMKPIPADARLTLLVEPEGKVAWLITTKNSSGFEDGELDWTDLAQRSIGIGPMAHLHRGSQGDLSFHAAFIKDGAHWKHLQIQQSEGYEYRKDRDPYHTYIPIKLPDGREYTRSSQFGSKQIQTIIEPLLRELTSRTEWNGVPLTKTPLTGAGRKRR